MYYFGVAGYLQSGTFYLEGFTKGLRNSRTILFDAEKIVVKNLPCTAFLQNKIAYPVKPLSFLHVYPELASLKPFFSANPVLNKIYFMDRRTSLATLFGKSGRTILEETLQASATATTVTSGLAPYGGTFGFEQAAHLLRRTTFGPNYQQIKDAADAGLDATFEQLFSGQPLPEPPLNHFYANDPNVPIGQTWVDKPYQLQDLEIINYRNSSLRAWTLGVLLNEGVSIREKLTMFWHNHYVTSDINDPRFIYTYITLLRQNAWGNFRELSKMMTIDPAMLRYLNGNDNTAAAPNENYARELLELFTIGKGPVAGPGDYTNYTEDDVVQMARVLTGWRDRGWFALDNTQPSAQFVPNRHDQGNKQLSHRFDNIVISNLGNQEYAHLIDIIFTKDECARFICRKLYRWFVYYVIDDQVETNVIEPMAQLLIASDYEIRPALEALLRSEHFFDMLNVGPMIKNPVDFVLSTLKPFGVQWPQDLEPRYRLWWQHFRIALPLMQMVIYDPPSVAGWKAYYQEPVFYRTWISSSTLTIRMFYTAVMATQGIAAGGANTKIDVLSFIATLEDPSDPNHLIEEISKILMPQPLTASQITFLKSVLIPGLPDFEWTVEYSGYLNNPSDPNLKAAVESKLRNMLVVMLSLPEFYLS